MMTEQSIRAFEFERDTFAFPHELVWKYHFDPVTGAMSVSKAEPPVLSSLFRHDARHAAIFLSCPF